MNIRRIACRSEGTIPPDVRGKRTDTGPPGAIDTRFFAAQTGQYVAVRADGDVTFDLGARNARLGRLDARIRRAAAATAARRPTAAIAIPA